jgi:NTP pyrophosphatase (non-canonical NTP hydrolase)
MDERYLDLLAEECAEVIQAIMKINRFGMRDKYRDNRTSKQQLLDEIGDVFTVIAHILKFLNTGENSDGEA